MEGVASDTGPSSSTASTVIDGRGDRCLFACPSSSRSFGACCLPPDSPPGQASTARVDRHAEQRHSAPSPKEPSSSADAGMLAAHLRLARRTAQHGDNSTGHAVGPIDASVKGNWCTKLVHRSIRHTVRHTSSFAQTASPSGRSPLTWLFFTFRHNPRCHPA